MDETQEKSVVESDSKEKIGNAINQLDLLHRLFINHADYGGHSRRASRQTSCRRSNYHAYLPLGCGSKTTLMSVSLYLRGPQAFPSSPHSRP